MHSSSENENKGTKYNEIYFGQHVDNTESNFSFSKQYYHLSIINFFILRNMTELKNILVAQTRSFYALSNPKGRL